MYFAMQAIEMSQNEITIYDIARALKISPATVSRGLKDHPGIRKETRKRIQEAAREMGYRRNAFASNLRRKRTNTIGVVIPRLNSYFMSSVIAGMEKVFNEAGYNLIISQSEESYKKEMAVIMTMFNSRVDGLLVSLAYNTENVEHFDVLLRKEIPLIFFDRVVHHPECTNIVIDNHTAGYDATTHLIEQGCKRIVHIAGSLNRNVYADRLAGYTRALEERGIEAVQKILAMDIRADAVFAANDTTAVAVIGELKQSGFKVPEDFAVVGFNNDPIASVIDPKLSTIHYPGDEMGEVAALTLMNRLRKLPSANLNTIVLKHRLIVRASSLRKQLVR
jgi:LacI family transcriptional regulator